MLAKNVFICLLLTFVLASCNKEEALTTADLAVDNSGTDTMLSAESRSGNSSTVAVLQDPDGPPGPLTVVPGASSRLIRNANGISATLNTRGLIPGNAYTMWWVIFGDAPGPPILVTYAAGNIVGGSGRSVFSGHLSVGDIFDNPLTAEVHLAIRTHGPAQPGMIPDQIHTFAEGCTSGYGNGPALYPDSDVVGYCANIQVAIHPGS